MSSQPDKSTSLNFFLSSTFLLLVWLISTPVLLADCYKLMHQPTANHIVLVIDCSGSMNGQPLADAKRGANSFLAQIKSNDRVALISFDDSVEFVQDEINNPNVLSTAVNDLRSGGATALYDGIARAALSLVNKKGNRVIVYLTDGNDNKSRYRLTELEKMTVSEGIFVYGIGLGQVDIEKLQQLSQKTSGTVRYTQISSNLENLYLEVWDEYYNQYNKQQPDEGSLVVTSIPDNKEVIINGRKVGTTPFREISLKEKPIKIGIVYNQGIWECDAIIKAGYQTVIDTRESDLGAELLIVSSPQGATVFIDDVYIGVTAIGTPVSVSKPNWVEQAQKDSRQLRISKIPYGNHRFRLRGIPDFDFGPDQQIEIEIPVSNDHMILFFDIFRQKVTSDEGKIYSVGRPNDPFSELDDDFDEGLDDF